MSSVRSSELLDNPAADVWAMLRDSTRLPDWFPGIAACTVHGGRRTVILATGSELTEDIVTLDDDLRRLQYSVVEGMPAATHHLGTMDVIAVDDHRCLVVYGTDIEPGALASGLQKSTDRALRGLRNYFT